MDTTASAPDERREHFRDLQLRSAKARSVHAVERRIRELVDSAPPLTSEQRDRARAAAARCRRVRRESGPGDDDRRLHEGERRIGERLAGQLQSTDGTDRTATRRAQPVNVWGYGYCTVGVRGRPATTMFVTCVFCGHCHRHTARPDFTSGKRKASCGRGAYVVHLVTLEGEVAA